MRSTERTFCQECKLYSLPHQHYKPQPIIKLQINSVYGKLVPFGGGAIQLSFEPRTMLLGFEGVIAACAEVCLAQSPQLACRIQKIMIPDFIAPFFDVCDIQIGKNSQFISGIGAQVPASIFSKDSVFEYNFDECRAGMAIIMRIRNCDGGAMHHFRAAVVIETVDHR